MFLFALFFYFGEVLCKDLDFMFQDFRLNHKFTEKLLTQFYRLLKPYFIS